MLNNQFVMVETAAFPLIVTIGILAATFSSALGSILGAPRILQALAEHGTVPASKFFAKKSKSNEPMNAMIFTAGFVVIAMMGDLNFLASLITMFFLITYGMLNLVVFIQQSMKIISFRPTIKIPRLVSFFGFAGCTFMMFLIDPVFSAIAIIIITLALHLADAPRPGSGFWRYPRRNVSGVWQNAHHALQQNFPATRFPGSRIYCYRLIIRKCGPVPCFLFAILPIQPAAFSLLR